MDKGTRPKNKNKKLAAYLEQIKKKNNQVNYYDEIESNNMASSLNDFNDNYIDNSNNFSNIHSNSNSNLNIFQRESLLKNAYEDYQIQNQKLEQIINPQSNTVNTLNTNTIIPNNNSNQDALVQDLIRQNTELKQLLYTTYQNKGQNTINKEQSNTNYINNNKENTNNNVNNDPKNDTKKIDLELELLKCKNDLQLSKIKTEKIKSKILIFINVLKKYGIKFEKIDKILQKKNKISTLTETVNNFINLINNPKLSEEIFELNKNEEIIYLNNNEKNENDNDNYDKKEKELIRNYETKIQNILKDYNKIKIEHSNCEKNYRDLSGKFDTINKLNNSYLKKIKSLNNLNTNLLSKINIYEEEINDKNKIIKYLESLLNQNNMDYRKEEDSKKIMNNNNENYDNNDEVYIADNNVNNLNGENINIKSINSNDNNNNINDYIENNGEEEQNENNEGYNDNEEMTNDNEDIEDNEEEENNNNNQNENENVNLNENINPNDNEENDTGNNRPKQIKKEIDEIDKEIFQLQNRLKYILKNEE